MSNFIMVMDYCSLTRKKGRENSTYNFRFLNFLSLWGIDTSGPGSNEEVPLTDVKSTVLNKVVEFCRHHVDSKLPEIEKVCIS